MLRSRLLVIAWGLLAAALILSSCSGLPLRTGSAVQHRLVERYAGKPVGHFTWITHNQGWEAIAANQLLVWTNINQAYLLTVFPPCTNLRFARGIGLTSTSDRVYAHFDFVRANGFRCMIKTIQPVDYLQVQRALRERRGAPKHGSG